MTFPPVRMAVGLVGFTSFSGLPFNMKTVLLETIERRKLIEKTQ
jgi:hypothetical protein